MKKYTVINNDTGEILDIEYKPNLRENAKVTKLMVDNMLSNANTLEDVDMDLLYTWCKITKALNKYNQVKLLGLYVSMRYIELSDKHPLYFGYASRLLNITHSFTNILMRNQKTWISTWGELYEELGIKSKRTQSEFKKYVLENDIIRVDKALRTKSSTKFTTRFILNPFLIRKSAYIGQIAISRFADLTKGSINVDGYAHKYLELTGVL